MCGIVGLQLRDRALEGRLGALLAGMLDQVCERGPDSAGFGLYGDDRYAEPGDARIGLLLPPRVTTSDVEQRIGSVLGRSVGVAALPGMAIVSSPDVDAEV